MSSQQNGDDDSFIILESSPTASLDIKCNGMENGDFSKEQIEEAMNDLSIEASMAYKAHININDGPSPASLMIASTIITDDRSTEELQKRFGELLDENIVLKDTLKHNNESMKEQFLLIASCQEDMMRTHEVHKEKFDQTKELVEKLRQENKRLKLDISRLAESDTNNSRVSTQSDKSGPMSALEFVTSPEDDTINKLTAQLDLVEKQRRQVIVDNEKLTWQKESLEHIVDATSKERDDLREKLKDLELQLSMKETEHMTQINSLKYTIQDLNAQIESASNITNVSSEEMLRRDQLIQQLEGRISVLQGELKNAQLRIFDLENIKLEFTKHRSGVSEAVKLYKDQIQDLHNRLKETSTTVFQPVRLSINQDSESSSESPSLMSNVKLYDRALKHLADLLNSLTHGMADNLVETLGLLASLQDYKLERSTADQFKSSLAEVKQQIEKYHSTTVNNIVQVRSTLTIFEGIFKDHTDLLKNTSKPKLERTSNVEALTAALVARGHELQVLQNEVATLRERNDNMDLMKAQIELYKSDFEAERESREKMACEKENIMTDLRTAQKRVTELTQQLDEVRKIDPTLHHRATTRPTTSPATRPGNRPATRPATSQSAATGNMVYTCPKCMRFSTDQYKVMEDHFDFCLDDF